MFVFLCILFSLGVAYGAKLSGRNIALWFALAVVLSPLVAGIALAMMDRRQIRAARRT